METAFFKEHIEPILPHQPGVYRFIGQQDEILYVGKAKNLHNRVSSYFLKSNQHSGRIRLLVRKAVNIHFTVVDSEHDALLLENSLIKEHQPRYNIQLKDDKTYPYIVIKNEPFPRLFLTRNKINDGSEYLGPFTSISRVKTILEFVRSVYPIRTCSLHLSEENIEKGKFKVCLEYHLGNCLGPCEGKQSEPEYTYHIAQIRDIVKGKGTFVIKALKEKMMEAAERFDFEQAEVLKRKVDHLEKYQSRSSVVNPNLDNIDVYGLEVVDDRAFANYFKVVQGSIVETYAFQMKRQLDETPSDLLSYAILWMQDRFGSPTGEILVPFMPEYTLPDVTYFVPQRGDKKKLVDLAGKNAIEYKNRILTRVDKHKLKQTRSDRVLRQLMEDFRMKDMPYHIECFDNSNFQGDYPVASTVVFKDGRPSGKDYRHYHVKTVEGPNDFASMEEIVFRRYKRLMEENQPLPQLVLIDGGKGQLNAALSSLQQLGIAGKVTLASIAKRLEEIYFPHDPVPLHISKKSESLKLLQQIRNEAHRFAITFHRQVRSKKTFQTELTDIPGIGDKTATQLLQHFKSIKKLREATAADLAAVVGDTKAKAIVAYFTQGNA